MHPPRLADRGPRAWTPAVLWSAVIFVLSSIPGDAFPRLPGWWNADKFVHGGIYACWARSAGTARAARSPHAAACARAGDASPA